jgi:DNA polymerase I-like protein with 3'-5' exonuclease and polymerase domains
MKTLESDRLEGLTPVQQHMAYNGLDGALTLEIWKKIPQSPTYEFERSMLPMVIDMMARGILIDEEARTKAAQTLGTRLARVTEGFDYFCQEVLGRTYNPRSYVQMQTLLYQDLLLPEVVVSKKGAAKISTDRDTLERLHNGYVRAQPFLSHLLRMRDLEKTLDTLTKKLLDGRWHASFNVGGTDTGRWSSSAHPFGVGSNLQNIDDWIRRIFIPDPGHVFFNCDQQGAEARVVGYLAGDEAYIKAIESGDVHTMVASMVFGFEPRRELADRKYYRDMSYRDIAKRCAHGCLTADHDVLTYDGWKPIDTVRVGELVACWDPTGNITFESTSHVTSFNYTGVLHHFEGTAYDLLVTHDHRMPYTTDTGFKVTSAETLPASARLPINGDYVGGHHTITPLLARRIAAMQADGTKVRNVRFHLKKPRKINRVDELFGPQLWSIDSSGAHSCTISRQIFIPEGFESPGPYLLKWSREALEAWLDETKYWDAHIGKTSLSFYSVRKDSVDWWQTIAALLGKGSTYLGTNLSGYGSTIHKANLNARKFARLENMQVTKIPTNGTMVHCLTVPTSYFLVRRNNKIMVTGNSNYGGTPYTIARTLKVETQVVESFQTKYFKAFPNIRKWQMWVAREIQTKRKLVTPMGRVRNFWDNPREDASIRAAIAYVPQSTVGDLTSRGLLDIWTNEKDVQILNNIHDAAFGQIPIGREQELLPRILKRLTYPMTVVDIWGVSRQMVIPWEAQTGYNWGKARKDNPQGLKDWS